MRPGRLSGGLVWRIGFRLGDDLVLRFRFGEKGCRTQAARHLGESIQIVSRTLGESDDSSDSPASCNRFLHLPSPHSERESKSRCCVSKRAWRFAPSWDQRLLSRHSLTPDRVVPIDLVRCGHRRRSQRSMRSRLATDAFCMHLLPPQMFFLPNFQRCLRPSENAEFLFSGRAS